MNKNVKEFVNFNTYLAEIKSDFKMKLDNTHNKELATG